MSNGVFLIVMLAAVGLLAMWVYARFPKAQPTTLTRALLHVLVSVGLFHLAPPLIRSVVRTMPAPQSIVVGLIGVTVPSLCYVLLSWIWFLAKLRDQGSSPRGGHPVSAHN
jgi:uncharacterized membrane protein